MNSPPVILIRESLAEAEEIFSARKYFKTVNQRSLIPQGSLVICRYSGLPFYEELERDVLNLGSKLLDTSQQFNYFANLKKWYPDFEDITPKTWFELRDIPKTGSFVLKGLTNSKKFNWKSHMFAENYERAVDVYCTLMRDSLIGDQGIAIREFVPLKKLEEGINGMPVSDEYRFFCYNGEVVAKGFYWSNLYEDLVEKPDVNKVPEKFIEEIVSRLNGKGFAVFDVAQTEAGNWILIELNAGIQSGLSMIDSDEFYKNLSLIFS
jgi:hypothetical protein